VKIDKCWERVKMYNKQEKHVALDCSTVHSTSNPIPNLPALINSKTHYKPTGRKVLNNVIQLVRVINATHRSQLTVFNNLVTKVSLELPPLKLLQKNFEISLGIIFMIMTADS
jgi:hypothetical protein